MEVVMEIRDIIDLAKLQKIQDDFSNATGLAAIAVDTHGEYITEGSNFTDFCMKYTRGSQEGNRRCVKCDNECSGTYFCHAGLMDFAFDIKVNGEKVGSIIGGQVLPTEPDEEQFRKTAQELDIDPDAYINALNKVPRSTEKRIRAAANLLDTIVNQLVNLEYYKKFNAVQMTTLQEEIDRSQGIVQSINDYTKHLRQISSKQNILALNASIEAARSGEAGAGFAFVAKSMQDLSSQSGEIYGDIEKSATEITNVFTTLSDLFK